MWENESTYIVIAILVVAALLTYRLWGDWVYVIGRNWRVLSFVMIMGFAGTLVVMKQQEFKYDLVYNHFAGSEEVDAKETRFQIRKCKEFVQAKLEGREVDEYRPISAGPINISKVSYWDHCAQTFGLNFWKFDTSIDGQDGGRLLCKAYARDTYRSSKVQTWCNTVFSAAKSSTNKA